MLKNAYNKDEKKPEVSIGSADSPVSDAATATSADVLPLLSTTWEFSFNCDVDAVGVSSPSVVEAKLQEVSCLSGPSFVSDDWVIVAPWLADTFMG